jgi:dihydrofolate reductase
MATLIYHMTQSLDGYTADANGNIDWSEPTEEVHRFVNDVIRPVGTFLFGRRMSETMQYWESDFDDSSHPAFVRDFAEIYQAADKVIYSTTLDAATTTRTRLERSFDPDAVRAMKATSDRDIGIGGPTLATHAIEAGLVDVYSFFVAPVIIGGGTKALPENVRLDLRLLDEKRFASGIVYLRYAPG